MNTKLTLSVSTKTIARAKKYAKKRGTSISKIFEDHITSITTINEKKNHIESLRKLKGIAKSVLNDTNNYKDLIADSIIKKHLKS